MGPMVRQRVIVEACGRARLLASWLGSERNWKMMGPIIPSKGKSLDLRPPCRPYLLPPNSVMVGTRPLIHEPLGDI
jgi:hypothetical protein